MAHTNTFTACYNCPSRQQNLPAPTTAPILPNDTNLLAPLRQISNCNAAFIHHNTSPKKSVINIHQREAYDFPTKNCVKYLDMIIKPKEFSQYLKAGSECVYTKRTGDQILTGRSQNCGQSANFNNKKRNKPTANSVPSYKNKNVYYDEVYKSSK